MFRPLPTSFAALDKAVQELDEPRSEPPPVDTRAVGERLRERYVRAREQDFSTLAQADWRRLPYAYWLSGQDVLPHAEPRLVQRYWSERLPSGLDRGGFAARRWLSTLFFVYCQEFAPQDPVFQGFAQEFRRSLQGARDPFALHLQRLHDATAFLDPERAASALAQDLAGSATVLPVWLERRGLWGEFPSTAMGAAVMEALLRAPDEWLREPVWIEAILAWMQRWPAAPHKSPFRVAFAEALLRPWHGRNPPEELRRRLVTLFTAPGSYGDPRLAGRAAYQWEGVSPQALAVLKRWLAGDTLRSFLQVLKDTADEIWQYREKFWLAYYDAGHIEEAWLALGTDAHWQMRRVSGGTTSTSYARLRGAQADQSVLILKIGHLVFTEWSHSGSLRAFEQDDPQAPTLYQHEYESRELRETQSMDFHDGMNQHPQLWHLGSPSGNWQLKARDFIRKHTGVVMDTRSILLR